MRISIARLFTATLPLGVSYRYIIGAFLLSFLIMAMPRASFAGGSSIHPPQPGSPPKAPEDVTSGFCAACALTAVSSQIAIPTISCDNIPGIINSENGILLSSAIGSFSGGIGCKDDRERDITLLGPREKVTSMDSTAITGKCPGIPNPINCVDYWGPSDGLQGVMPNIKDNPHGMPHKDTPAMSLVANYPWLYKETDAPWSVVYRGTGNSVYQVLDNPVAHGAQQGITSGSAATNNAAFLNYKNNGGMGTECQIATNTCQANSSSTTDTSEFWTRLALDSCTNQYILPLGLNPDVVLNEGFRSDFYPWNENDCQALLLMPVPCKPDLANDHSGKTCLTDNGEDANSILDAIDMPKYINSIGKHNMYDYRAWGYLERAWLDVLYTKDSSGNNDPYSPASGTDPNTIIIGSGSGITLPNPIDGYNAYGALSGSTSNKGSAGFNYGQPGTSVYSGGNTYDSTQKFTGKLTTINELATRPYERIWDSTHPFTPRWDVVKDASGNVKTDRSYSSQTYFTPLNVFTQQGYITPFGSLASYLGSNYQVRCAAVPVDILTFRAAEFDSCMQCRIDANNDCFWHEYLFNNLLQYCCGGYNYGQYPDPATALLAVEFGNSWNDCNNLPNSSFCENYWTGGWLDADQRCKTNLVTATRPKYNLAGTSGQWPPCSTMYDYPFDNVPALCNSCVQKANDYADNSNYGSAPDYGDNMSDGGDSVSTSSRRLSSVTKCCNDLAQPVAPINTLKIRNLQDDPTIADASGNVAEGYKFSDYFPSGHMPYMRWWDTGTAAGGAAGIPYQPTTAVTPFNDPVLGTNYNPNSNKGKDDVIVGIGTENSGICRYGGSAGKGYSCISVGAKVQNSNPTRYVDRLTSWYELKQAQVNMIRDYGMDCLPTYEKMWKWAAVEEGPLYQGGKHFNTVVPEPNDATKSLGQLKTNPWPLRWRGYLSDSHSTVSGQANSSYPYRFPNFDTGTTGGTPASGSVMTGLDNAKIGDIIYVYHTDKVAQSANSTLSSTGGGGVFPFMAVVTGAWHGGLGNLSADCTNAADPDECTDSNATCSDHITVQDVNNGKYPDACGVTDYIGMGQPRTIYKEWLPINVQNALFAGSDDAQQTDSCGDTHTVPSTTATAPALTAAGNCMDPKYSDCTFMAPNGTNYWNNINVYRPSLDERGDLPPSNGNR